MCKGCLHEALAAEYALLQSGTLIVRKEWGRILDDQRALGSRQDCTHNGTVGVISRPAGKCAEGSVVGQWAIFQCMDAYAHVIGIDTPREKLWENYARDNVQSVATDELARAAPGTVTFEQCKQRWQAMFSEALKMGDKINSMRSAYLTAARACSQ